MKTMSSKVNPAYEVVVHETEPRDFHLCRTANSHATLTAAVRRAAKLALEKIAVGHEDTLGEDFARHGRRIVVVHIPASMVGERWYVGVERVG